jgi:hypothetical protein
MLYPESEYRWKIIVMFNWRDSKRFTEEFEAQQETYPNFIILSTETSSCKCVIARLNWSSMCAAGRNHFMDEDLTGETCGCPEEARQVPGAERSKLLLFEAADNF